MAELIKPDEKVRDEKADESVVGLSDVTSEVPESLQAIMQSNSAALAELVAVTNAVDG